MANRILPTLAVGLGMLASSIGCAGGGSPAEPFAPDANVAPGTMLSGVVVDQFSGSPLSGLGVTFGARSATTGTDGRFLIQGPQVSAPSALRLEGASIVERSTFARSGDAVWQVLPEEFDLEAFDDLARERGRTVRWGQTPTVYIDTRPHHFDGTSLGNWINETAALLPAAIEAWTGGRISTSPISTSAPPTDLKPGTIVIRFDEDADIYPGPKVAGLARIALNSRDEISAAVIRLRFSRLTGQAGVLARRAVLIHEVGHALGLGHMDRSTRSVMEGVIRTPEMTEFDRRAGTLLYGRAPGNQSLDRDTREAPMASLASSAVSTVETVESPHCEVELSL
jgi:hypothetical protein